MEKIMMYLFSSRSAENLNRIISREKERDRFINGLWSGTAYKISK